MIDIDKAFDSFKEKFESMDLTEQKEYLAKMGVNVSSPKVKVVRKAFSHYQGHLDKASKIVVSARMHLSQAIKQKI